MPWTIKEKDPSCDAAKPFGVHNQDTGRLVGCHATRDDALGQQRALYANVPDSRPNESGQRAADEANEQLDDVAEDESVHHRANITIAANGDEVEERAATVTGVDFPQRIITVLAVPYEDPTPIMYRGEIWQEVFSRAAFGNLADLQSARSANRRTRYIPVSAKLDFPWTDHEGSHVIGRVHSVVGDRADGLVLDLKISDTPVGNEALQLANDQALHPSVGFSARMNDIAQDRYRKTRRVNRAFLDHMTMVPVPAYAGAKVLSMRAADAPQITPKPNLDEFLNDPVYVRAQEYLHRDK